MRARNPILAIVLLAFLPTASSAVPALTFEPQALLVTGLAPGGEIAYLSVARESTGFAGSVVRREGRLRDEDQDGAVRIGLEGAVPWRSIWVVVEVGTGAVVAGTPEGYPLRDAAGGGFAVALAGVYTRLGASGDLSHLLVVRPGTGAWVATLEDGAAADEDGGANGTIVSDLATLEPLANGPPAPLALLPGDRVIAIDSSAMAWSLEVVGGAP